MGGWVIAAVATTVFMSLYDTEDFRVRMNMKIAPTLEFKLVLVFIMVANFIFCYVWEVLSTLHYITLCASSKNEFVLKVFFLDGILFAIVLPWYKEKLRGPNLPFQLLDKELSEKPGWPPVGSYRNNDAKIGNFLSPLFY